jgi:hypothetical protein
VANLADYPVGPAGSASGRRVVTDAQGRRKRLSADLPQHWLHDPRYFGLSDRAWRLHTHALMWAIGRTDGFIPRDILRVLMPQGRDLARRTVPELVRACVWAEAPALGGWQIVEWELSQSTVGEIEKRRLREREKKQRQRANVPGGTPPGEYGTARHGTAHQQQPLPDVHSRESERSP